MSITNKSPTKESKHINFQLLKEKSTNNVNNINNINKDTDQFSYNKQDYILNQTIKRLTKQNTRIKSYSFTFEEKISLLNKITNKEKLEQYLKLIYYDLIKRSNNNGKGVNFNIFLEYFNGASFFILHQLFCLFDKDKDGILNLREFGSGMMQLYTGNFDELLELIFLLFKNHENTSNVSFQNDDYVLSTDNTLSTERDNQEVLIKTSSIRTLLFHILSEHYENLPEDFENICLEEIHNLFKELRLTGTIKAKSTKVLSIDLNKISNEEKDKLRKEIKEISGKADRKKSSIFQSELLIKDMSKFGFNSNNKTTEGGGVNEEEKNCEENRRKRHCDENANKVKDYLSYREFREKTIKYSSKLFFTVICYLYFKKPFQDNIINGINIYTGNSGSGCINNNGKGDGVNANYTGNNLLSLRSKDSRGYINIKEDNYDISNNKNVNYNKSPSLGKLSKKSSNVTGNNNNYNNEDGISVLRNKDKKFSLFDRIDFKYKPNFNINTTNTELPLITSSTNGVDNENKRNNNSRRIISLDEKYYNNIFAKSCTYTDLALITKKHYNINLSKPVKLMKSTNKGFFNNFSSVSPHKILNTYNTNTNTNTNDNYEYDNADAYSRKLNNKTITTTATRYSLVKKKDSDLNIGVNDVLFSNNVDIYGICNENENEGLVNKRDQNDKKKKSIRFSQNNDNSTNAYRNSDLKELKFSKESRNNFINQQLDEIKEEETNRIKESIKHLNNAETSNYNNKNNKNNGKIFNIQDISKTPTNNNSKSLINNVLSNKLPMKIFDLSPAKNNKKNFTTAFKLEKTNNNNDNNNNYYYNNNNNNFTQTNTHTQTSNTSFNTTNFKKNASSNPNNILLQLPYYSFSKSKNQIFAPIYHVLEIETDTNQSHILKEQIQEAMLIEKYLNSQEENTNLIKKYDSNNSNISKNHNQAVITKNSTSQNVNKPRSNTYKNEFKSSLLSNINENIDSINNNAINKSKSKYEPQHPKTESFFNQKINNPKTILKLNTISKNINEEESTFNYSQIRNQVRKESILNSKMLVKANEIRSNNNINQLISINNNNNSVYNNAIINNNMLNSKLAKTELGENYNKNKEKEIALDNNNLKDYKVTFNLDKNKAESSRFDLGNRIDRALSKKLDSNISLRKIDINYNNNTSINNTSNFNIKGASNNKRDLNPNTTKPAHSCIFDGIVFIKNSNINNFSSSTNINKLDQCRINTNTNINSNTNRASVINFQQQITNTSTIKLKNDRVANSHIFEPDKTTNSFFLTSDDNSNEKICRRLLITKNEVIFFRKPKNNDTSDNQNLYFLSYSNMKHNEYKEIDKVFSLIGFKLFKIDIDDYNCEYKLRFYVNKNINNNGNIYNMDIRKKSKQTFFMNNANNNNNPSIATNAGNASNTANDKSNNNHVFVKLLTKNLGLHDKVSHYDHFDINFFFANRNKNIMIDGLIKKINNKLNLGNSIIDELKIERVLDDIIIDSNNNYYNNVNNINNNVNNSNEINSYTHNIVVYKPISNPVTKINYTYKDYIKENNNKSPIKNKVIILKDLNNNNNNNNKENNTNLDQLITKLSNKYITNYDKDNQNSNSKTNLHRKSKASETIISSSNHLHKDLKKIALKQYNSNKIKTEEKYFTKQIIKSRLTNEDIIQVKKKLQVYKLVRNNSNCTTLLDIVETDYYYYFIFEHYERNFVNYWMTNFDVIRKQVKDFNNQFQTHYYLTNYSSSNNNNSPNIMQQNYSRKSITNLNSNILDTNATNTKVSPRRVNKDYSKGSTIKITINNENYDYESEKEKYFKRLENIEKKRTFRNGSKNGDLLVIPEFKEINNSGSNSNYISANTKINKSEKSSMNHNSNSNNSTTRHFKLNKNIKVEKEKIRDSISEFEENMRNVLSQIINVVIYLKNYGLLYRSFDINKIKYSYKKRNFNNEDNLSNIDKDVNSSANSSFLSDKNELYEKLEIDNKNNNNEKHYYPEDNNNTRKQIQLILTSFTNCEFIIENKTKISKIQKNINYTSPEEISKKECSEETDVWGIGVLTYFLFTSQFPFDDEVNIINVFKNNNCGDEKNNVKNTAGPTFTGILSTMFNSVKEKNNSEREGLINRILYKETPFPISVFGNYSEELVKFIKGCLEKTTEKRTKLKDIFNQDWFKMKGYDK